MIGITLKQLRYFDALARTGPVWLIAHSQGGNFALDAVARHPEYFHGVVIIEPASAPDEVGDAYKVPHLFLWGDNIQHSRTWMSYREPADLYADRLGKCGGSVDTLGLPANGFRGNSHVPMMDKNSDAIAELVKTWIGNQAS